MLISLLHELIHAADDCQSGHKGAFAEAATRLGFEGPMTKTPPGLDLTAEVITLAEALGPFPHARLDPTTTSVPVPVPPGAAPGPGGKVHSGPGKQGTRMIKLTAACCGYTVRTTRKWLDEGYPLCPHGQPHARGLNPPSARDLLNAPDPEVAGAFKRSRATAPRMSGDKRSSSTPAR